MLLTASREAALRGRKDSISVVADARTSTIQNPDPGQRIQVREELLDANPGRPGVPVSIPGLPAETASGGIKAPQYFAPGVAGDHGEPIAQFIQLGGYLIPNNLSANAHGNGYADPNILVPAVIETVATDGGAFNVLEGNPSVALSAAYGLRTKLAPFVAVTGLQFNEGPSRNRATTLSARRYFREGLLQTSFSKADARDLSDGLPLPEAPRTIVDIMGTLDRLPWHLQARAEFEQVGAKPLGDGFVGAPIREFRGALSRSFRDGKLEAGVHFQIASGYSGQTTEVFNGLEQILGVDTPATPRFRSAIVWAGGPL